MNSDTFDKDAAIGNALRTFAMTAPIALLKGGVLNTEAFAGMSKAALKAWRDREIAVVLRLCEIIDELRNLRGTESTKATARLEHRLDNECDARCQFLGHLLAELESRIADAG
jgi:hypothetical protein